MTLELTSIPLAWLAGILGIASPCVWPLVPVVMSSAGSAGTAGAWMLGLGLSAAFAFAGTVLTLLLLNLGLDPEAFRGIAAVMLMLVAAVLLLPSLFESLTARLSLIGSRLNSGMGAGESERSRLPVAQFGVGALLGLVWLPCVGPTLGAAIGLASLGQSMALAFVVMFSFGVGTASALLFAGTVSRRVLLRWRPGIMEHADRGRRILGGLLLLLGLMVVTGVDRVLETYAVRFVPQWAFAW